MRLTKKLNQCCVAMAFAVATAASAQTDPAVSTHNYKHPNKAMQAASSKNGVVVPEAAGRETVTPASAAPRYKVQKPRLVFTRKWKIVRALRSPFQSPHHYKAAGPKER